ncbi:hypothetical protein [Ferruginibacter sp.]
MKNVFNFLVFFFLVAPLYAQKKLVPVSQSALTGISLPNGSKKDSRMLSVGSAKMLLEIESKKANTSLAATEVLLLPSVSASGFNADSLVKNLTDKGWAITIVDADNKYAWLQKNSDYLMMYFSMNTKETGLYFAKANAAPVQNTPANNTEIIATANTANDQQQQTTDTKIETTAPEIIQQPTPPVTHSGFAFTTTNFDDGWTSTVQEDWVEATKGNIKVLIHYPNKNADAYSSDLMEGLKHAWNVLVAPKYSSATNMEFKPLYSWQSIEFAEADMVEKISGRNVHVVFFKKNYSGGNGKFLEFITPDKNSFEKEFGPYSNEALAASWDKMAAMANYNKFAVAASDLNGKWTSNFTGMTQYVNAYTGADAGANTHASNENFEFGAGNTYKWDLGVASGFVGNIKFQSVKSAGKFTSVNNWQVKFSDIEGKPKTYNVQFVCIKGARVLWIGETGFGKKE